MCGIYAVNVIIIFILIEYLYARRVVEYFGADPEGSILMLLGPTMIGYFLIGLAYVFISDWLKFFSTYFFRRGVRKPGGSEPGSKNFSSPVTGKSSSGYDPKKGMGVGALVGFAAGFLVGILINPPFPGITNTSSDGQGLVYFSWFFLGMAGLIVGSVLGVLDFRKLISRTPRK